MGSDDWNFHVLAFPTIFQNSQIVFKLNLLNYIYKTSIMYKHTYLTWILESKGDYQRRFEFVLDLNLKPVKRTEGISIHTDLHTILFHINFI